MKKKMLFVCVENSGRSQMAEGFARHYGADKVEAYSAGSHPSGAVNPSAIAVMQEIGIDISRQHSKGLDALPRREFDAIVTMGCGDACPNFPAKKRFDWKIDYPKGKPVEAVRKIRDEIGSRVKELLRAEEGSGNFG